MAPSESLTQVRLDSADVLAGVALSDASGWNQTADDWQLFVQHGKALGWRTADSQLVATAAALGYGRLGWISMVLVAKEWRHGGLATHLLGACIDHLQREGITPVLDATPAGEPVYRRLGFQSGFDIERWEGEVVALPSARHDARIRPADAGDVDTIIALDTAASGLERRTVLGNFLQRHGTRAWMLLDDARGAIGFVIARRGRSALQIGPLVARTTDQAAALLDAAFAHCNGRVFLDLPSRWTTLAGDLRDRGLRVQRPFVRMALAATLPDGIACVDDRSFVIAGPEFG